MRFIRFTFVRVGLLSTLAAMFFGNSISAVGQKEWLVHSFDGTHGDQPMGNLIADSAGDLYGTAFQGGAHNWGVIYELLRPVPPKTAWIETVLYSFSGTPDGGEPEAGLLFDKAGNLYGTTNRGGAADAGTVFELIPPVTPGGAWTESVLHSFQPVTGDGGSPETGLTWDHSGNLIGVTPFGGGQGLCNGGCGTVFQLSPPSTQGGEWTETIIQAFKQGQGAVPRGTPAIAANGVLYGTTYGGGLNHEGVIYRLTPPATLGGAWTYRVLHAFTDHFDGGSPRGALVLHGKGILYGTTLGGGTYGGGTVFELVPPASAGGLWTENVLHSFGSVTGEGSGPSANVVFNSAGNIYGITIAGGDNGGGTAFQLTPPSSPGGDWTETVLHSFDGGKDGASPSGGLIFSKNGVLFGVTQTGGTNREGAVYAVVK